MWEITWLHSYTGWSADSRLGLLPMGFILFPLCPCLLHEAFSVYSGLPEVFGEISIHFTFFFWLHWVFITACRLFIVASGLSLVVAYISLAVSLVAVQELSSCGT